MQIELRFFAGLREALGTATECIALPGPAATARDVLAMLRERGGAWADALADERRFRVAVDHQMGGADSPVRDGAEVAFFPPVTGG